jgi:hypothetical protein
LHFTGSIINPKISANNNIFLCFIFRKLVVEIKIYWNKETNSKNIIGQRVKELRTERQLSQKALAEKLQLAGFEFNDLTVLIILRCYPSSKCVSIPSVNACANIS